jgi:quinol monooxygenase YgiN
MALSTPVSHLVFVRSIAGRSSELGQRLQTLIKPSLSAPGCLRFALQQSMQDADLWSISGSWSSEQAMNAWFASPELQVFSALVHEMIVRSLDFHTFAAAGDTAMEQLCVA